MNPDSRLADTGFGRPRGIVGRIGGRLMARGNAAAERRLVELAALQPAEKVLVLGPGPGVGVRAAAARAEQVVAIDPSELMLDACRRRCAAEVAGNRVRLVRATAADTQQDDNSADVALAVNNVSIWPDRHAGCVELFRVLRPGGRLLLSTHQKWLPGGPDGLADTVAAAGFIDIRTRTWQPPGRFQTPAAELTAAVEVP